jgi:hypothetical protein
VNLEPQAEPAAMAARAELQVLEGQAAVHLGRLVRMASTVTEVRQVMVVTAATALTERLESLVRLQAKLGQMAKPAAMVEQAELRVLAAQPVVCLARLGPAELSATEAMPVTAEPVELV